MRLFRLAICRMFAVLFAPEVEVLVLPLDLEVRCADCAALAASILASCRRVIASWVLIARWRVDTWRFRYACAVALASSAAPRPVWASTEIPTNWLFSDALARTFAPCKSCLLPCARRRWR